MAKIKTFAVIVEVVEQHTLFVEARKAGGATELIQTETGWDSATRYNDDVPRHFDPRTMRVVKVTPMPYAY